MKEAIFWQKIDENKLKCLLCNHFCTLKEGDKGICGVRVSNNGKLYSLNYGKLVAENIDPIEKKPFFHFLPGSTSYSIASAGCNFKCLFCQNYNITDLSNQYSHHNKIVTPTDILSAALSSGCKSISYTYTEPTIFYEFAFETSKIAKEKGIKNLFVTNGYMSRESIKKISPYLDAANVDIKGDEKFYLTLCGAKRAPVIENIQLMKELGIWVEVTTLLIPEYNDSQPQIEEIVNIIKRIDPNIPWHVSRFFPTYKMGNHYPTPIEKIERARKIGLEKGLKYVYTGNILSNEGENTYCYSCKTCLIQRKGYNIETKKIRENQCSTCGAEISGIFG